jgi:hypothetical protein
MLLIFLKYDIVIILLLFFYQICLDKKEKVSRDKDGHERCCSSSSGSVFDEHDQTVLLGVDHDEAPQAPSLDVGSSSASSTHRACVPSKQDVYTGKYIAQ